MASQQVTMILGAATTIYTFNQAGVQTSENSSGAVTGFVYDGENRLLKETTLPLRSQPMLTVETD